MTDSFLERVARKVSEACGKSPTEIVVVLPSQRAAVYFRKHFAALSQEVRFAPVILTLDKFVAQFTPLKPGDRIEMVFQLYESYLEVWQSEAESFDRFLKWAQTALSDFSEIDAYLLDSKAFFRDLTNLKELDSWSLNAEELTPTQQQYAWFWKQLDSLYQQFSTQMRKAGVAYSGMLFRDAAENIEQRGKQAEFRKVFFCGFNALSRSEERIMHYFCETGKGEVLWDADQFYVDYPQHEAGMFLRKNFKTFEGEANWITKSLTGTEKTIAMVAAPNEVAQTDYMAHVLSTKKEHSGTAVVLANPNLLLPVLNGLPDSVENANVTMGLKLRNSPLHSLFELLFEWIHARRPNGQYHYRHATRLMAHPYLNLNSEQTQAMNKLVATINKQNKVFLDSDWITNHCSNAKVVDLFRAISISDHSGQAQLDAQFALVDFIIRSMGEANAYPIEKEYIHHYLSILRRLRQLVERFPNALSGESYARIFNSLIAGEKLNFVGEPLGGLQIMGMLETRALDFDELIILSCNEKVMPGSGIDQSLIPFELKKFHHLPTHTEREAIYGYYFYRLLQRAKKIHLVYSTDSNDWQGTEPSRYIAQIKHDLKDSTHVKLESIVTRTEHNAHAIPSMHIPKSESVISALRSKLEVGLSPSALNKYLQCPLDFYYTYIVGYREADEVEETVEHATLGSAVHAVLEQLYMPYKNAGVLKPADVQNMRPKVKELTRQAFDEHYSAESMQYGMNNLIFEVALKFIDRFLSAEIKALKEHEANGEYVEILDLEKPLSYDLKLHTNEGDLTVRLMGNADRIDKIGNTIRVIDYKTGKVEAKDVSIKDPLTDLGNPDKSKALQLMVYGLMYFRSEKPSALVAGNIAMRNLEAFLQPVNWGQLTSMDAEIWDEFENELKQILLEIISPGAPLEHRPEAKYCNFCDSEHETY